MFRTVAAMRVKMMARCLYDYRDCNLNAQIQRMTVLLVRELFMQSLKHMFFMFIFIKTHVCLFLYLIVRASRPIYYIRCMQPY